MQGGQAPLQPGRPPGAGHPPPRHPRAR